MYNFDEIVIIEGGGGFEEIILMPLIGKLKLIFEEQNITSKTCQMAKKKRFFINYL